MKKDDANLLKAKQLLSDIKVFEEKEKPRYRDFEKMKKLLKNFFGQDILLQNMEEYKRKIREILNPNERLLQAMLLRYQQWLNDSEINDTFKASWYLLQSFVREEAEFYQESNIGSKVYLLQEKMEFLLNKQKLNFGLSSEEKLLLQAHTICFPVYHSNIPVIVEDFFHNANLYAWREKIDYETDIDLVQMASHTNLERKRKNG